MQKPFKFLYIVLNLIGLILSSYVTIQVFNLSVQHLKGPPVCPVFLGIPLCIVVLISYKVMTVAWFIALLKKQNSSSTLFIFGFTPASLFAVIGSTGEIFSMGQCPHTSTGIPKCYISFGVLIVLAFLWTGLIVLKKTEL